MTHIGSGSDYTIYWYNGAGTWTLENGGGVQIAESTVGNVWLRNSAGSLYAWNGGAWVAVPMPLPLVNWWGGELAPISIAVAPDQNLWMVANMPYSMGSNDHAIFQMVQFNSPGDNAWTLMPGGGVQISVSPIGKPWLTNYEHVAFALETLAP